MRLYRKMSTLRGTNRCRTVGTDLPNSSYGVNRRPSHDRHDDLTLFTSAEPSSAKSDSRVNPFSTAAASARVQGNSFRSLHSATGKDATEAINLVLQRQDYDLLLWRTQSEYDVDVAKDAERIGRFAPAPRMS